jgi:hypothetical protein
MSVKPDPYPSDTTAFDLDRDLPGAVWMVPNHFWDIVNRNSTDHPGASVHYRDRDVILVAGTDAENPRTRYGHYVIAPTPANGLDKLTAFALVPRYLRLHRFRLLYPERYLGRLDPATLGALCEELARLWPEG